MSSSIPEDDVCINHIKRITELYPDKPAQFASENPCSDIESITKEIREAKIMWVKAHEMFQQDIDDIKKEQDRIVKHLNHATDVINKVKRAWEDI